jgi:hypothetical protein
MNRHFQQRSRRDPVAAGEIPKTAVEGEREITAAARARNLARLAAAAHKLKGATQAVGAGGQSRRPGGLPRPARPLAVQLRPAIAEIRRTQ